MKKRNPHIILIILSLLLFLHFNLQAQQKSDSLFILKGRIIDRENFEGLPNVHIINKTLNTATVSSYDGSFKIASNINDSLIISMVGYKKKQIIVQPEYEKGFYEMTIRMDFDIINMEPVIIYGKTFAQFREDFKSLHINSITMNQLELDDMNEQIRNIKMQTQRSISVIQTLYNRFNKKATFRRKLQKQRNKWNDPELFIDFPINPNNIPEIEWE